MEDIPIIEVVQPASMTRKEMGRGVFLAGEVWWKEQYTWLLERGYQLRPRYDPAWVPSWKGKPSGSALSCEDGQSAPEPQILDATRLSDGATVVLKRLSKDRSPTEVEITTFLTSPELSADPRNHCISVYETLQSPLEEKYSVLVLPLLRTFYDPQFDTIGEIVSCLKQLFEGLQFMHENLVAHRDGYHGNIMMDASPLYPEGWHFTSFYNKNKAFTGSAVHLSRSEVSTPVKYYFIDFGIAVRFDSADTPHLAEPVFGADRSAPELQGDGSNKPSNPFLTDIYYMGNMINQVFLCGLEDTLPGYRGLDFLKPLVAEMTHADPSKRPKVNEVVTKFDEIVSGLSRWKLRSPAVQKDEFLVMSVLRSPARWKRSWDLSRKGFPPVR
jgi:serine/threonine protein kinase